MFSSSLSQDYPNVPPVFEIEANRSRSFTFSDADRVYDALMATSISSVGDMMIFSLVTVAKDTIRDIQQENVQRARQKIIDDKV